MFDIHGSLISVILAAINVFNVLKTNDKVYGSIYSH